MNQGFVYLDKNGKVKAISSHNIFSFDKSNILIDKEDSHKIIGKKINQPKEVKKLALICNWDQECGISTYTKFLVNALQSKVEIKIFSENGCEASDNVIPCWNRGHNMSEAIKKVLEWQPDFVLIQHEFGLFPKATHFLQMLHMLSDTNYAVVLHSVYEHLDKTVCTSAISNIICHSEEAKQTLIKTGNNSKISVIHHGCPLPSTEKELWNIFQTPYCIMQFGFGFFYKGVDIALDAIHLLKSNNPEKYKDIFYCYLCSTNEKTSNIQNHYYEFLTNKINDLGLQENVAIIRKFQTEETLHNYLRTAKLAIFPYITDPNNTVYGASGAIRIAMSENIPVIASKSHLFDDLENTIPRISNAEELAAEINKIFNNHLYKNELISKNQEFLSKNTWDNAADKYLEVMKEMM